MVQCGSHLDIALTPIASEELMERLHNLYAVPLYSGGCRL